MPPHSWREGDVSMLLRHMDECGIEKAVVFPPFACQMDGDMREANVWALRQIKGQNRLIPFGTVSPVAPDAADVLHLLVGEGIAGAKVHPSIDVYDLTDPKAMAFYAEAARFGFILDFHTGPHGTRLSLADPVKLDTIAWEFPELRLVFEHVGGRTHFEVLLAVLANHRKSTFAGITSVLDRDHNPLWHLGPERLGDLVRIVGPERLVFGLDFPWNPPEQTRYELAVIRGLGLPKEAEEKILGVNLLRLLGLERH